MSVSITINETKINAEPDMTVLEVARSNDIYIPTLCHSPKLPPAGACRMCVVEIKNMRGFPTACTVPVAKDMVIHTETEAVQNLRREILSLILSEHPYTCLVCNVECGALHSGTIRKAAVTTGCQYCPANGQCDLQDLVDYLGVDDIPYPITYRGLPVEKDDPFFDRDYNLCILCGRCVRACQEVRHNGVLAFVQRGSAAIVGTAFNRSHLDVGCEFCGACVDVCPTGSLADKRGKWEGVPTTTVTSVCPYCSVGCAVNVQAKDGKVIRAVGHNDGPANDGQLCVRGRFGMVDVIHDLTRLKSPLLRRKNRMMETSWDEALDVVAEKLGKYQPNEVAVIASATATNETGYTLQKFARTTLKTNNVALAADFPEHKNSRELLDTLKNINGPMIRDVRDAVCILAIGTNPFESHPILGLEIRHALVNGADLITIDTRQTEMANKSSLWLQPQIGTDHILLAGIIKSLLDEDLVTKNGNLAGYPELSKLDLKTITATTGVSQETLLNAAKKLAEKRGQKTIIIYGSGITHYASALDAIKAIQGLAFLMGDETGIMGVMGEVNFVGTHDMGVHPALLPGYRSISSKEDRAVFETAWNVTLNPEPGRSYEAILNGIRRGEIKALYLAGEVPLMPEFAKLELLVVQDIVSTENLQYADIVLPETTFAEMNGSLTSLEGRVQRVTRAIPPVGLSRPGWMIARDIAERMSGRAWNCQSAVEIMTEIQDLIPAYAAVSLDTLGIEGCRRRFETVETKLEPFSLNGTTQLTTEEYPLALITEHNLYYYRGVCLTERVKGMNLIKQEEIVHLHSADAERLGIAEGVLVSVVTPHGSAECIVQVTNGLMPEGSAFVSFNRVSSSPLFPTLSANTKACPVRIETIEG